MQITTNDVAVMEQPAIDQESTQLRDLGELELMLVGGGQGDINFG